MGLTKVSVDRVRIRKRLDTNPAEVCTAVTPDMIAPLVLLYQRIALGAPMNVLPLPVGPLFQQRIRLLHLRVLVNFPLETRHSFVWDTLTSRAYRAKTGWAMERRGFYRIFWRKHIESRAVGRPAKLEFLRVGANVSVEYQLEKVLQVRTREDLSEGIYWDRHQAFDARQDRVLVCDSRYQEAF